MRMGRWLGLIEILGLVLVVVGSCAMRRGGLAAVVAAAGVALAAFALLGTLTA